MPVSDVITASPAALRATYSYLMEEIERCERDAADSTFNEWLRTYCTAKAKRLALPMLPV